MKYKVKRENIEELHKVLGKGGVYHTETSDYLNKKDRQDTKRILNQIDYLQDLEDEKQGEKSEDVET